MLTNQTDGKTNIHGEQYKEATRAEAIRMRDELNLAISGTGPSSHKVTGDLSQDSQKPVTFGT